MDNEVVISIMLIAIAVFIVIQIIKKLFKLVTLGIMVACLVFGINYATNSLSTNYGIVFDSSQNTISMPFTQEYSSEYRKLVYNVKNSEITLYSGNEPTASFSQKDITDVELSQTDSLQTIQIQYNDQKIDMQTQNKQAKVLYSVLKTMEVQNDAQFKLAEVSGNIGA